MEIPSIYAPPTISTDFYTIPEQAIGKYVDTSIKNWQTNEDNVNKIDMALNSIKTFSELEEDKNVVLQPYKDAINQATNLAKTDPNSFLTQGGKLRNIGRQLVQDMTTGKIGQYSQAYEQFNTSLKENLENKNKNPNDVQEIFNSYKPAVIDALKKGEPIPNVIVPNYFDTEKYLDSVISKMDPNTPQHIKENLALRALNNNRNYQEYVQHFPERNSPVTVGNTPDGKPVYIGYRKDENGKFITDENGNFVTGRTLNEKDGLSAQAFRNQELINNTIGIYTPAEDDSSGGSGSKSKESQANNSTILTKGSPSEQSTLPIYTPDRKNDYNKQLEEINNKLGDENIPPDVRAAYERRKKILEEEHVDAKNRHSYLSEMTVEAMKVEASKNPNIDVNLIGKIPEIERQIKELTKYENLFSFMDSFMDPQSVIYTKKFSDLKAQLEKAKRTTELYNAKYNFYNRKLSENQVNPTIGLNIIGNKDLQQTVFNMLQVDPNTVTKVTSDSNNKPVETSATDEINDTALTDIGEIGIKFKTIKSNKDGNVVIEAIGGDGKSFKYIINNPDASRMLENAVDNKSFNPEVRNFVRGFSNPQITKVGREVESALNPVDGAYYGPLKEIIVDTKEKGKPIKAVIRKTSEGGIAMVTYDSRNNKRRVWRLSDNNGTVASALINLASNPPMEASTNIRLEGESTNNEINKDSYFVDPEKVHIFNDTNIVNENTVFSDQNDQYKQNNIRDPRKYEPNQAWVR